MNSICIDGKIYYVGMKIKIDLGFSHPANHKKGKIVGVCQEAGRNTFFHVLLEDYSSSLNVWFDNKGNKSYNYNFAVYAEHLKIINVINKQMVF